MQWNMSSRRLDITFRCLDAEKLVAAKSDSLKMEKEGIVRRSASPWSSPLHMVMKKHGKWQPYGNYRQLNDITVPDKYPVLNIPDMLAK
jgi:hypothetical protein